MEKKYPLLRFENFRKATKKSDIPWEDWKTNLQENIKTIKEINFREENAIREKEIKTAIQKRCQDLETNQKRMINSLTDQRKNTIILDRILIKSAQDPYISTDAQEILKETEQYYKETFKTRNSNFDQLNEEWKKEYLPKTNINKKWYDDLMSPITEEEFNTTLKDLPNGKASGISLISYEMLKKLGPNARRIVREFFSLCLAKGSCPPSWKTSSIFPIPKSKDWECDLTNTRPIILLETSRKCLTKIITNRLSSICKRYNILSGPNFAGLPGESTQEPIHLLNNICEEAREKKKELWICFQDTAKAFDTVNLEMLQKAMERIKIPTKAIKFIINLFKNRVLKAITSYGLTQNIIAGDGLDQGETISPLLWRIFYDPLLHKIQKNNQLGYTMETRWRQNLNDSKENKIKLRTAATAFMDDTTWVASSKSNMQKILDEAAIFYKANDSQINGKKSVLIVINGPKNEKENEVFIGPNRELLKKIEENDFTRYLGIWIGEKDHKKYTIDLMQREISRITQALKYKKMTDKQILYILNRVLIPRLEYRAQHCFLTENECKKLTAQYMGKFKNAINISSTCPNSVILYKGIYSLKSVWEIQSEALVSNFTNRLNDIGPTGKATKIRLKDAQILNWEPSNIITTHTPQIFKTRGNLQANILTLAHKLGIAHQGSTLNEIFEWKKGEHPIKNIIQDQKQYLGFAKQLAKANLMFLDQIIDRDNGLLIGWQTLTSLLNLSCKGRIPKWFNIIKDQITIEGSLELNKGYSGLTYYHNSYEWSNYISSDKRKKEWAVQLSKTQNVIWGKIANKGCKNKLYRKFTITHYECKIIDKENFIIIPCNGCELNDPLISLEESHGLCNFRTNRKHIRGIRYLNSRKSKGNIIPYNYIGFRENIEIELRNSASNLYTSSPSTSQPLIAIQDLSSTLINKWIKSEIHNTSLIESYRTNLEKDKRDMETIYEFYTDGSLKNRGSIDSVMGSAWIQVCGPNPNTTFQVGSISWPSSSKAEAIAILTALLTVPEGKKVKIFTDSQVCIDIFLKMSSPHPKFTKKKLLKINNWAIWTKIIEASQSKKLRVELIKVKAHSGDIFNEWADKLAKEALNFPIIKFSSQETGPITSIPIWNGIHIDISIREFVKEIHKRSINSQWADQNRNIKFFSQEIQNEEQYEWSALWKKQTEKKHYTSPHNSKEKAFWIKIMHNELPTLDNLAIRKPKLYYDHQKCPLCLVEKETINHLFHCPATQEELKNIWPRTEKILFDLEKDKENPKETKGKRDLINRIKRRANREHQGYLKTIVGLVKKEDVIELKILTGLSENRCRDFILKFCEIFRRQFQNSIWKNRCKEVINMEITLGITSRRKKSKGKENDPNKNSEMIKEVKRRTRRPSSKNPKSPDKNLSSNSQIQDKIKSWVQYGKKWLGF